MTPAQSMALVDIADEHPESGFAGHVNSTAPARPAHHYSYLEDEGWDVHAAHAPPARDWLADILNMRPTASSHQNFTTSSSTAEPPKCEGAEPALPLSVDPAKQPEYAAQSASASKAADSRLAEAATMDDVLAVLRESGLVKLAARVVELHRRHQADPEEHPMPNTASLKRMAQAVLTNDRLRTPDRLAVNDEGFFTAEWTVGQAELVLSFWPSSHIRFAALDTVDVRGSHLRVGGLLSSSDAVNAVRWLVSRIPTL